MPCNGNIRAVSGTGGFIQQSIDKYRFLTDLCCPSFVIQAQIKVKNEYCASCFFAKDGIFATPPECLLYTTRIVNVDFSKCAPCDLRPLNCQLTNCLEGTSPSQFPEVNCDPISPPTTGYTTTLYEFPENGFCYQEEQTIQQFWNSVLTEGYTNCCKQTTGPLTIYDNGSIVLFPFQVDCPAPFVYSYTGTAGECTLKETDEEPPEWVDSLNGYASFFKYKDGVIQSKKSSEFRIYHTRPPTCSGYLKIWTRIKRTANVFNTDMCIAGIGDNYTYTDYDVYEFSDQNSDCSTNSTDIFYTPVQDLNPSKGDNGYGESLELEWKFSLYPDCEPPWPQDGQSWNGSFRTTAACMTSPNRRV